MDLAIRSLLVLVLFMLSSLVHAADVKLQAIKTENGMRINFDSAGSDFVYTYNFGFLVIKFPFKSKITNYESLKKFGDLIDSVKVVDNYISIKLDSTDYQIERFDLQDSFGVEITDVAGKTEKSKPPLKAKTKEANLNSITTSSEKSKPTLKFTFDEEIAASAMQRDNRIMIVFNKPYHFSNFPQSGAYFSDLKVFPILGGATLVTMKLKENDKKFYPLFYRSNKEWILEFGENKIKPSSIRIVSRPLAAPLPRVEIQFDEKAPKPIEFNDPYVGDDLLAFPIYDNNVAVTDAFTFVDFTVPVSLQGVFINKISDQLNVNVQDNIAIISGYKPLNIAPHVYTKKAEVEEAETTKQTFKPDYFIEDTNSILSLRSYVVSDADFIPRVNELTNEISNASNPQKRARIYANGALFYLANEMYPEAAMMIKLLKTEDPNFAKSYNVALIEGVIRFMRSDYMEANKILRGINLYDVPIPLRKEIRFWQAIVNFKLTGLGEGYSSLDIMPVILEETNSFIVEYTDPFKFEIGISAAEFKLKDRSLNEILVILEKLNKLNLSSKNKNKLLNIYAKYFVNREMPTKAIETWDDCIKDIEDLQNRVICRFEKANYLNETQRSSIEDYINELEKISTIWRGDDFEISVLLKLGAAYEMQKDYASALRSWNKIITYFPYSSESLTLSRQMGQVFTKFFIEKKDENVSHLKALALFYEFEKLIPIGEKGDEIVLRFVDHLISVDLLDRAIALLNHQIRNRLNGNKREEAINKLARVQLMNQAPMYAIEAIEFGDDYSILPDYIANERKYIHAMALFENNEDDKALQLLKGDFSYEADKIKSGIFWRQQNWKEFNKYAEPRIYSVRFTKDKLTYDDSRRVLKLAISYMMLGENKLLKDLYADFNGRLVEGKYQTMLNTLMETWGNIGNNTNTKFDDLVKKLKDALDVILKSTDPKVTNPNLEQTK